MLSKCNYSQYGVHYQYNISAYQSEIMTTKIKMGMFLMTGLVLAVAAIYSIPMQQATACGNGCGKGHGGGSDGGSLVNVEDIGNVQGNNIGNVKALNNNHIGNLKDINVLSKNYLKDVNVLSKNNDIFNDNYFDTLSDNFAHSNVLNNIIKHNNINTDVLDTNILNSYYKEICGC
jgi:hypothetical protein